MLLGMSTHAQKGEKALLDIINHNDTAFSVVFTATDFHIVRTNGYCTLEAAGMRSMAPQAGMPVLPQMSRIISMPRGTTINLT